MERLTLLTTRSGAAPVGRRPAAFGLAALAACLGRPRDAAAQELEAATLAAAKLEGIVTFYSTAVPEQNDALIRAFQKAYGIRVNVFRGGSGPLWARIEGELQANNFQADVVVTPYESSTLASAAKRGLFAPIDKLPGWAAFPEAGRTDTYARVSVQRETLGINTDRVNVGEVAAWPDILNRKWKGAVVIVDPQVSSAVATFFLQLAQLYGDDFLRKLGAQQPKKVISSVAALQLLASGEASLGFPFVASSYTELKAAGAPVEPLNFPKPNLGPVQVMAVTANAPHPNAARLFVNFTMTWAGQQAFNQGFGSSLLADIPGTVPLGDNFTPADTITPSDLARVTSLLEGK